jgi:uncharacterized membrane protein
VRRWLKLATDSEEKLRSLEAQLAQLTGRVQRIEQALGTAETPVPRPTYQAPSTVSAPPGAGVAERSAAVAPAAAVASASRSDPSIPTRRPLFEPPSANEPTSRSGESSSLESVIGGQWLNRLGILAVLVGLSYFLKLAIENNWIGPATRVLIGLAAGVGLLLWSERFRKRGFGGFSYSLKALGIGALYLSLWASFQLYHLVSSVTAFGAMVLVTLTSAGLSMAQDSELLAGFALVGGFLTPVLVSTGENREVALLSYLMLLDLGAVWVVAVKGWKRLLAGAFVGTMLLFGGWALGYYSDAHLTTTTIFATLFFLLFAAIPFVGRGETGGTDSHREIVWWLLVLNAAVYFGTLLWMMAGRHQELLAWMAFAVAGFYFALSRTVLGKWNSSDFEALHLVLAIAFFTAGILFLLNGRWITFAWDVEAAGLLWLGLRTGRQLWRNAAAVVLGLAIVRLLATGTEFQTVLLLNPRFGLFVMTIAVAAVLVFVSLRWNDRDSRYWAGGAVIVINLLALFALSLEVQDYFRPQLWSGLGQDSWRAAYTAEAFTYSALWMLYGTALMVVGFWKREAFLRWQGILLLAITAVKVFFFDIATLQRGYRITAFIVLGVILLAVSFFYQRVASSQSPVASRQ